MCLPAVPLVFAAASTALSVASSVAAYQGQVQQTKAIAKYQNTQYSEVGNIAQQNYFHTIDQVNLRNQQEAAAASDQYDAKSQDTLRSQSAANAVLSERGISGTSVNALLDDFSRINATDRLNTNTNLSWQQQQSDQYLKGAQAEAKSRIAQASPAPLTPPSQLGTLLQIGTSGLSGWDQYMRLNRSGPYQHA